MTITPPDLTPVQIPTDLITYRPVTDVVPFTYRASMTYQQLLESLRHYLIEDYVPWAYNEFKEFGESWAGNLTQLITTVDTALEQQSTTVQNALTAQQQQVAQNLSDTLAEIVAGSNAQLNDAHIAASLQVANSTALAFLDTHFQNEFDSRYFPNGVSSYIAPQMARLLGFTFVTDPEYDGGADPSGVNDSAAAIEAAWLNRSNRGIYFPCGLFKYNNVGLDTTVGAGPVNIIGAGPSLTEIRLGATSRLIDTGGSLSNLHIAHLKTGNGLGLFRSTITTPQVADTFVIDDVWCYNYTATAIETNASDWPFRRVINSVFQAASWAGTMGIAFSGLTDGVVIDNCIFHKNQVGIKMELGAGNAYINRCVFEHWDATTRTNSAYVWVVPKPNQTNAGQGLVISDCRFGNENTLAGDRHIVYADPQSGSGTFGARFPDYVDQSNGYIDGHRIRDCMFSGNDSGAPSPVFSTTPNIWGFRIDGELNGTMPPYILEYLTAPSAGDRQAIDKVFGPFIGSQIASEIGPGPEISNDPAGGHVIDPNNILSVSPRIVSRIPSLDPVDYVNMLTTPVGGFGAYGTGTTVTAQASVYGVANDAGTLNLAAGGQVGVNLQGNIRAGYPVWVEFDGATGTDNLVRVRLRNPSSVYEFSRVVRLDGSWHRYAFDFLPRVGGSGWTLILESPSATVGKNVKIGRVRVYQSRERVNTDGVVVINQARYRLSVSGSTVSATAV